MSRRQEQEEDEEDVFQPQLGNVVFASAHDGWAFRPAHFAALYAAKLGANPAALGKASLFDRCDMHPTNLLLSWCRLVCTRPVMLQ